MNLNWISRIQGTKVSKICGIPPEPDMRLEMIKMVFGKHSIRVISIYSSENNNVSLY